MAHAPRASAARAYTMSESDHRPLLFVLILGMMCIVTIAVAAHLVIRKAVRDLVARSAAKQLQMDALAFKTGAPLRQLDASPATCNRNLLSVISTRI